jgi:outer membrane protein, heavy metal efflux system
VYAALTLTIGLAFAPPPDSARGGEPHLTEPAPVVSLGFEEALARARELAPERALRRSARELEGSSVGVGPFVKNPTLELSPNLRFSPSSDLGPEGQLIVRFPLDVAGLGSARERVIDRVGAELEAQADELGLDGTLSAARAWLDLWVVVETQGSAERDAALARELVGKLRTARSVEEASVLDVLDAEVLADEAELAILALEGERHDRALRLARVLAMAPSPLPMVVGSLPEPELPAIAGQASWPAELPAVRRAERAAELAEARAAEARAASATDLSVGWSLTRDAPQGWTTGAVVAIGLPWFDRAQASTAEYESAARLQAATSVLERERGRADLAAELHEVEHTRELSQRLEKVLVPRHEAIASARQRLVEAGEGTVNELVFARRALVAARRRAIEARAAHALARVRTKLFYEAGAARSASSAGAGR